MELLQLGKIRDKQGNVEWDERLHSIDLDSFIYRYFLLTFYFRAISTRLDHAWMEVLNTRIVRPYLEVGWWLNPKSAEGTIRARPYQRHQISVGMPAPSSFHASPRSNRAREMTPSYLHFAHSLARWGDERYCGMERRYHFSSSQQVWTCNKRSLDKIVETFKIGSSTQDKIVIKLKIERAKQIFYELSGKNTE